MRKEVKVRIRKGRGALSQPANRFHSTGTETVDDGWNTLEREETSQLTQFHIDTSRTILSYNQSPDVPVDRSINPYRGCEHGCIYCFARPTHAWLDLSPGLDFETQIFYKPAAAELLRRELAKKSYRCAPVCLGINTDAYQPAERKLEITRRVLQVLQEARHPVSLITKSALIERDRDILTEMAQSNLVHVMVSVTTLDSLLARRMEPRAASPARRLQTIKTLSQAGIPTGVLVAPLIPVLTDHEMETILQKAYEHGARAAGYVLIRLPHEVSPLFREWLYTHEPLKAGHIMKRIRDCRGGKDYDSTFGKRGVGEGIFAEMYSRRFQKAIKRLGYGSFEPLNSEAFRPIALNGQISLF